MDYEWDEQKRIVNLAKHGLDLAEAWMVYESPVKITIPSARPIPGEVRWIDIATVAGTPLILVYTIRGKCIRCISFRRAKQKERRVFDAAFKNR